MSVTYLIHQNGEQKGPFTLGQMRSMWAAGGLSASDLFWSEGMGDWRPLTELAGTLEAKEGAVREVPPPLTRTDNSMAAMMQFQARQKSPIVALLLNFVFPGLGYFYAGAWLPGVLFVVFWLGLWFLSLVVGLATMGIGLVVMVPVILIFWIIGIVDGWLAVERRNKALAAELGAA